MSEELTRDEHSGSILTFSTIGFLLCVILTVAAYYIVQHHIMPTEQALATIVILGVVQLLVQATFFFRLNTKTASGKWDLLTFFFTILIIAIVVCGSLWIMYNLNYYMVH